MSAYVDAKIRQTFHGPDHVVRAFIDDEDDLSVEILYKDGHGAGTRLTPTEQRQLRKLIERAEASR